MKKRKTYIKRIVCILVVLSIPILYLSLLQVRYDHNNVRIENFYKEEPNSLDVIVLGASETYSGYSPTYAYDKYKYTGYVIAIEDNPVQLYKSEIAEILSKQKPKYIIIEISGVNTERLLDMNGEYFDATMRKYTDSIPISENKIQTVNSVGKEDDKTSYYLPFVMYHSITPSFSTAKNILWNKFRSYSYLKGTATRTKSEALDGALIDVVNDNSKIRPTQSVMDTLDDLLDYCKSVTETNFIFTRFPHRVTSSNDLYYRYQEGNYVGDYIKQNGFDYIDLQNIGKKIDLNYEKDFADDDHLNGYGQRKLTKYIGNILCDKFEVIPSQITLRNQKKWQECVKYMKKFYTYFESEYENTKPDDEDVFICELPKYVDEINQIN